MISIIFLGVGGWISEPFLGFTSILIEVDGRRILIDAGEGVYKSLRCCGYDLANVDAIVVTHKHGDHVLGIPTVVLMSTRRSRKIKIISIQDVIESIVLLFKAIGMEQLLNNIDFVRISPYESLDLGPIKLSFIEALHTVPAISVRVDANSRCIVFSGDTKYNPRLADFAKNCDVLIHEVSSYSPNAHLYGHSSYPEALEIASKANVRIFVPIHFYQQPIPIDISCLGLNSKFKVYVPMPCTRLDI